MKGAIGPGRWDINRYFGSANVSASAFSRILNSLNRFLEKPLAVALEHDFGVLLDPVEIHVISERRLLSVLFPGESRHLGRPLDRQAACFVKVEGKILAVRSRYRDDRRWLVANFFVGRRRDLETLAFQRQQEDGAALRMRSASHRRPHQHPVQ